MLWKDWWELVCELRCACARTRTFLWMALCLAGLTTRKELAGVTSIVRAPGLVPACYDRLLDFFHSPALGWGADGASRQPLGLVIVGGLVVSQLITLFVTPVIYLYMELFQEKVLNRIPFFAAHYESHAEAGALEHVHEVRPDGEGDNGGESANGGDGKRALVVSRISDPHR